MNSKEVNVDMNAFTLNEDLSEIRFRDVSPLPPPQTLLRRICSGETTQGLGKVKVLLRICDPSAVENRCLSVERKKKQVALLAPVTQTSAPKLFSFDAVFTHSDSQNDVCAAALVDVIHAVMSGSDGCVFSYGHQNLGKIHSMVGDSQEPGVIPCAIWWLFRAVSDLKQRSGSRFSVRVSALEVHGDVKDLLAHHVPAGDVEARPGVLLNDAPVLCELRVSCAEHAVFYLDEALSSRTPGSLLLYRLQVYKYDVTSREQTVFVGRSRLHLIDFGCNKNKSMDSIPNSVLGNILIGIFGGNKNLPYRDHRVNQLLRDCLGLLTCHVSMIVHVSGSSQHYQDTLATLQLASRIHRLRHHSSKRSAIPWEVMSRLGKMSSDFDPSSSEQSADTVIYVGGGADDSETDGEHPPLDLPVATVSACKGKESSLRKTTKYGQANGNSERQTAKPKDASENVVLMETWIDGPLMNDPLDSPFIGTDYENNYRKCMVRDWLENQSTTLEPKLDPRDTVNDNSNETLFNKNYYNNINTKNTNNNFPLEIHNGALQRTNTMSNVSVDPPAANGEENTYVNVQKHVCVHGKVSSARDVKYQKGSQRGSANEMNGDFICSNLSHRSLLGDADGGISPQYNELEEKHATGYLMSDYANAADSFAEQLYEVTVKDMCVQVNEAEIDMDMSKMLSSKELDGSSESCFILQDVVKQRSEISINHNNCYRNGISCFDRNAVCRGNQQPSHYFDGPKRFLSLHDGPPGHSFNAHGNTFFNVDRQGANDCDSMFPSKSPNHSNSCHSLDLNRRGNYDDDRTLSDSYSVSSEPACVNSSQSWECQNVGCNSYRNIHLLSSRSLLQLRQPDGSSDPNIRMSLTKQSNHIYNPPQVFNKSRRYYIPDKGNCVAAAPTEERSLVLSLRYELQKAKSRLLPNKVQAAPQSFIHWPVDPIALRLEADLLKRRIAVCKSRLMMVTCFDIRPKCPIDSTKIT